MNIVVLGPPGSGRNTIAQMIERKFGSLIVSTGHLLLSAIENRTDLGREAIGYMNEGVLVPDKLIYALVNEFINKNDFSKGICFTGFPKTVKQGEALDKVLAKLESPIERVINLELSDQDVVRRMTGRLVCLKCGSSFHQAMKPPKDLNTCDKCHSMLEVRDDDKPEVIARRLKEYYDNAQPLLDYYDERGFLSHVDASGPPELVFRLVCGEL